MGACDARTRVGALGGISDNRRMAKRRVHRSEGTPSVSRGRSARSGGQSPQVAVPTGPGLRARFERASAPWLMRMAALPPFVIPALLGITLFLGLVLPSRWAGLLLLPIAVFLVWLCALSWPSLSTGSRALRLLVAVGMSVLAVLKLAGIL